MENNRAITAKLKWAMIGTLTLMPLFSLAYDSRTTHPALTQEIVKFFNQSFPTQQLNDEEKELIIKGSIDEDADGRWMRHFYDPVHNRGLSYLGTQWQSSKEWGNDTLAQATYRIQDIPERTLYGSLKNIFTGETDYSWERGIYEYAWGDRKRGLATLGHILHLLEDMSVPDHTRNDPHPGIGNKLQEKLPSIVPQTLISFLNHHDTTDASPYESWTTRFNRNSIKIDISGEKPIIKTSISNYFDAAADYSNKNFFSKDTIFSLDYVSPLVLSKVKEKLSDGKMYQFGFTNDSSGNKIRLILLPLSDQWHQKDSASRPQLEDRDDKILSSYFTLLSRSAILHGSGLIDLFFSSVKQEKKTKVLYHKNRSWLAQKIDGFKSGTFAIAGALYGTSVSRADLEDETGNTGVQPLRADDTDSANSPKIKGITGVQPLRMETRLAIKTKPESKPKTTRVSAPANAPAVIAQNPQLGNPVSKVGVGVGGQTPNKPSSPSPAPSTTPPTLKSRDTSSSVPIAGAGAPAPASSASSASASTDTTPPSAPVITAPSSDGAPATSTSVSFSGTAEASAVISNGFSSATTTASSAGNWALSIPSLAQGTSTIQFFAKDTAGNVSPASSRIVFIDSIAPLFSLNVSECASSLATSGCLIATTTVSLSWPSTADDLSYYSVTCETSGVSCASFSFASTTATSTIYTTPSDNTTYTFRATATDTHGAVSSEQTYEVIIATRPVVINEIAWAGTSASRSADEWMELYNPTDKDISLSGWVLAAADNTPYIPLSGNIPAHGYFVLERTDDTAVTDVSANLAYGNDGFAWTLNNTGETLELSYSSTTMDKTPAPCGNFWCLGSQYNTMERYDPLASGTDTANWASYAGMLGNGKNADNADITGTPGKRNSVNYFIDPSSSSLSQSKTLSRANNPYIIPDTAFTVQLGATLTIDPGVVIKFHNTNSALVINGAISAAGTASLPIVFTSFHDDDCGITGGCGDTNAATTSPSAGDWGSIKISSSASSALFDHAIIRYGGINDFSANYYANLRIENASTTVKNSTIEKSKYYGIYLKNASAGTIASNTIKNNGDIGLLVSSSTPSITANALTQNKQGLVLQTNSNSAVSDNTITQNTNEAIVADGSYPSFSGNSASSNGTNAIQISGTFARDYTLSTDIPWLIATAFIVPSGKTLTAPAGAVVKFKDNNSSSLSVQGKILAQGTAASKVAFTSIRDDGYGGDTNGDGSATSPAAGNWLRINFTNSTATSTLTHAIIRYGGTSSSLDPNIGAVRVENTSIELKNAAIESNYTAGLWLKNSTSTSITDSTIQNHRDPASGQSYGVFMLSSSPSIQNTLFKNNTTAMYDDGGSSVVNLGGISFDGNTTDDNPNTLIP